MRSCGRLLSFPLLELDYTCDIIDLKDTKRATKLETQRRDHGEHKSVKPRTMLEFADHQAPFSPVRSSRLCCGHVQRKVFVSYHILPPVPIEGESGSNASRELAVSLAGVASCQILLYLFFLSS